MSLGQIHFVEDPESRILPGYFEVEKCKVWVFSMAWFGLMNTDVLYIQSPNTETAYKAISQWFISPPQMIRQLTKEEVNRIIADIQALSKRFERSDGDAAMDLLKSALFTRKSVPGIPGGLTTMDASQVGEYEPSDSNE